MPGHQLRAVSGRTPVWPVASVESRSSISAADHLALDLRARAGGVRADQRALQLGAHLGRDVPGRQRAEPGRDPVRRGGGRGELLDDRAGPLDGGQRLVAELDRRARRGRRRRPRRRTARRRPPRRWSGRCPESVVGLVSTHATIQPPPGVCCQSPAATAPSRIRDVPARGDRCAQHDGSAIGVAAARRARARRHRLRGTARAGLEEGGRAATPSTTVARRPGSASPSTPLAPPADAPAAPTPSIKVPASRSPRITGPLLGGDVSWPQCPKGMGIPEKRSEGLPMPDASARFVVIGLTNGPGFVANPCLAEPGGLGAGASTCWSRRTR